ncbi:uncharacterized protein [Oryza sativa Japonica Group]|uniref:uncharacterized protein n=1 Tax=Oryza sativa subsp. japonica TaxID=39947 RepID=UPI00339C2701
MGKLLDLKRLMSVPKERNRRRRQRQIRARNGSIDSVAKRKGSLCQQVANSDGERRTRYSGPNLPEDYQGYVLSLVNHRVTIGNLEVMRTAYRLLRQISEFITTTTTTTTIFSMPCSTSITAGHLVPYTLPDAIQRCCPCCMCVSCFSSFLATPPQSYILYWNTGVGFHQQN